MHTMVHVSRSRQRHSESGRGGLFNVKGNYIRTRHLLSLSHEQNMGSKIISIFCLGIEYPAACRPGPSTKQISRIGIRRCFNNLDNDTHLFGLGLRFTKQIRDLRQAENEVGAGSKL